MNLIIGNKITGAVIDIVNHLQWLTSHIKIRPLNIGRFKEIMDKSLVIQVTLFITTKDLLIFLR